MHIVYSAAPAVTNVSVTNMCGGIPAPYVEKRTMLCIAYTTINLHFCQLRNGQKYTTKQSAQISSCPMALVSGRPEEAVSMRIKHLAQMSGTESPETIGAAMYREAQNKVMKSIETLNMM